MTHRVEICAFCKVYVEDEENKLTDDEAVDRAMALFLKGKEESDQGLDIGPEDVIFARYDYNFG